MNCLRCGHRVKDHSSAPLSSRCLVCDCQAFVHDEHGALVKGHADGVRDERARILKLRVHRGAPPEPGPTWGIAWRAGWTAALRAYRRRIRESREEG